MFRSLLVPIDFSPASVEALRRAVALARETRASLLLLHVALPPELYYGDLAGYGFTSPEPTAKLRERVRAHQAQALDRLALAEVEAGIPFRAVVREGYAPDVILEEARGDCDLVVMGTHGRTGLARVFVGSVTERVVRECPKPVLVVRAQSQEKESPKGA